MAIFQTLCTGKRKNQQIKKSNLEKIFQTFFKI